MLPCCHPQRRNITASHNFVDVSSRTKQITETFQNRTLAYVGEEYDHTSETSYKIVQQTNRTLHKPYFSVIMPRKLYEAHQLTHTVSQDQFQRDLWRMVYNYNNNTNLLSNTDYNTEQKYVHWKTKNTMQLTLQTEFARSNQCFTYNYLTYFSVVKIQEAYDS